MANDNGDCAVYISSGGQQWTIYMDQLVVMHISRVTCGLV